MTAKGPCVDASTRGRPVLQPDLGRTTPELWTGFGPAALEPGIEAIFAFPLQVGGIRLGVLDLSRESAGTLNPSQLAEALWLLRARAFSGEGSLLAVAGEVIAKTHVPWT